MFDGILELVLPSITFENEIFNFIIYILNVSIRCGLLAYVLGIVHNVLRLSVSAPKNFRMV